MKKILFLALWIPVAAFAQSQEQNYVKTVTYKVPLDETPTDPADSVYTAGITYFDGLGRPIQHIAGRQSPNGYNIVTHTEYDEFGRQPREHLPYEQDGATGLDFTTNGHDETFDFYGTYREGTTNPFSEKLFEASPLNRVLKQAAPGNDWAMDGDHTIQFDYQVNDTLEVKLYTVTTALSGLVYEPTLDEEGYYPPGMLYKTITKDENWTSGHNHTTEEFKDTEGRVILKRTYEDGDPLDTYYVYDIYGNLTYVLPPLAQEGTLGDNLEGLCYQYKYDTRNRVAAKRLPGKQWEYIVYDKLDRPVLTGPAYNPYGSGETGWLLTKYDQFGRVAYTGWLESDADAADRASRQSSRDASTDPLYEDRDTFTTIDGESVMYTNDYFITSFILLTVNYYDNYSFPDGPSHTELTGQVEGKDVLQNTKGMATGTLVRVMQSSSNKEDISYTLYDEDARPVRAYKKNYLGGHTIVDSRLDFAGKTLYSITRHERTAASDEVVVREDFTYTAQDRPLAHIHTIGTNDPQLLAHNTYDQLGQLITKDVGGTDVTDFEGYQKVDYQYNIRGWLTAINKIDSLSVPDKDLFAFKINYNTVENTLSGQVDPLYNGNISETFWQTSSDNVLRKYGYQYDALNRMTHAYYQKPDDAMPVTNSYNENAAYDANGNITHLKRKGDVDDPTTLVEIDDLSYTYTAHTNQLKAVDDASNDPSGFNDHTATTDYTYDSFGNMISDGNKHISSIHYNHLDQPVEINFSGGSKINYLYDANGVKVKKVLLLAAVFPALPTATATDYLDGFQYVKDTLRFFPHAEGYVNVLNKDGDIDYNYVFNYTDHLGNIRVSYGRDPSDGELKILEENNYYPFGLRHRNYNMDKKEYDKLQEEHDVKIVDMDPDDGKLYKYKYNGKEYQDELGLNEYDYGARFYDPAIGRWYTVDEMAEKFSDMSPYNYGLNNPVIYIDPDGNEVEMCCDGLYTFLEKVDRKAEQIGQKVMTGFANLLPPVAAANAVSGATSGQDIYGNSMTKGDIALEAISVIPIGEPLKIVHLGEEAVVGFKTVENGAKGIERTVGESKSFETYTKTNPQTGDVYSGRTSGIGTPEENIAKRDTSHHMNDKGYGPAKLDKSSTSADAIRGREQQNINRNGGAKSQNGTSGNAINAVSPKNPKAAQYQAAAKKEFGQ